MNALDSTKIKAFEHYIWQIDQVYYRFVIIKN